MIVTKYLELFKVDNEIPHSVEMPYVLQDFRFQAALILELRNLRLLSGGDSEETIGFFECCLPQTKEEKWWGELRSMSKHWWRSWSRN